ncbi:MAG TPA: hypothetical protein VF011_15645 [Terriglobales bacterium]
MRREQAGANRNSIEARLRLPNIVKGYDANVSTNLKIHYSNLCHPGRSEAGTLYFFNVFTPTLDLPAKAAAKARVEGPHVS